MHLQPAAVSARSGGSCGLSDKQGLGGVLAWRQDPPPGCSKHQIRPCRDAHAACLYRCTTASREAAMRLTLMTIACPQHRKPVLSARPLAGPGGDAVDSRRI